MYSREGIPEKGELVICRITSILPHSAFVNLEEFGNKEAMLHDSELSRRWTRNRKSYLKIDKILVCKVVKSTKEGIYVSVKRVSPAQAKSKQEEWKLENKSHNILIFLAKQLNMDLKEIYKKIGEPILKTHGWIYPFLLEVAKNPDKIKEIDLEKKLEKDFLKLIKNRITLPQVKINAKLKVSSKSPNGIEILKNFFKKTTKYATESDAEMKVIYFGAPNYKIQITAKDYKIGETLLKNLQKEGEQLQKNNEIAFELNRK